jgi:FkbM family methyltransferase
MISPTHLIHSEVFERAVAKCPLTLVDVGARGELDPPWDEIPPSALQVVGFEPDRAECTRLSAASASNMRFLPVALWSGDGEVDVHIAATPTCSSVHPPNQEVLRQFDNVHVAPRATKETVRYPATSLDSILAREHLPCDFLKIDTQGAEGEIVCGAASTLRHRALGALIETWSTEIHQGQQLTGSVMTRMHELGFQLFDINVAAAWRRRPTSIVPLSGKPQIVGLDLLFLRDPRSTHQSGDAEVRMLKAAALAEVFGFPDYALELLDTVAIATWAPAAREAVLAGARGRRSLPARAQRLVRRLRGQTPGEFAPLHA